MLNQGATDLYLSPVNLGARSPHRGIQIRPNEPAYATISVSPMAPAERAAVGSMMYNNDPIKVSQADIYRSDVRASQSDMYREEALRMEIAREEANRQRLLNEVEKSYAKEKRIRQLELSLRTKGHEYQHKLDSHRHRDSNYYSEKMIEDEFGNEDVRKEAQKALEKERHRRQRESLKYAAKDKYHTAEKALEAKARRLEASAKVKSNSVFSSCRQSPRGAEQINVERELTDSYGSPRSIPYSVTPRKTADLLCCASPRTVNKETYKLYADGYRGDEELFRSVEELYNFRDGTDFRRRLPAPKECIIIPRALETAGVTSLVDVNQPYNRALIDGNVPMRHLAGKSRAAEILAVFAEDLPTQTPKLVLEKRCGSIPVIDWRQEVLIPSLAAFEEASKVPNGLTGELPLWQSRGFILGGGTTGGDLALFFQMGIDGKLRTHLRPLSENLCNSHIALDLFFKAPLSNSVHCDEYIVMQSPAAIVKTRESLSCFASELIGRLNNLNEEFEVTAVATVIKLRPHVSGASLNGMDMVSEMGKAYQRSQLTRMQRRGSLTSSESSIAEELGAKADMCDVAVKCQNRLFLASRSLLMARSPIFSKMLTDRPKAAITINNADPELCRNMVDFIHTDSCPILERSDIRDVLRLLELSAKFRVPALGYACSVRAGNLIDPANIGQIYETACRVNNPYLKAACLEYGQLSGKQVLPGLMPNPTVYAPMMAKSDVYTTAPYSYTASAPTLTSTYAPPIGVEAPVPMESDRLSSARSDAEKQAKKMDSMISSARSDAEKAAKRKESDLSSKLSEARAAEKKEKERRDSEISSILSDAEKAGVNVNESSLVLQSSANPTYSGVYRDTDGNFTNVSPAQQVAVNVAESKLEWDDESNSLLSDKVEVAPPVVEAVVEGNLVNQTGYVDPNLVVAAEIADNNRSMNLTAVDPMVPVAVEIAAAERIADAPVMESVIVQDRGIVEPEIRVSSYGEKALLTEPAVVSPRGAKAERAIEELIAKGELRVEVTPTGEKKLKKVHKEKESYRAVPASKTKPLPQEERPKHSRKAVAAAVAADPDLSAETKIKVAVAMKDGEINEKDAVAVAAVKKDKKKHRSSSKGKKSHK